MKPSERYWAMAAWFRTHEFTPHYGEGICGCFLAARMKTSQGPMLMNDLGAVIGTNSFLDARDLRNIGWTGPEATRDAEAACMIASDICAAEGR